MCLEPGAETKTIKWMSIYAITHDKYCGREWIWWWEKENGGINLNPKPWDRTKKTVMGKRSRPEKHHVQIQGKDEQGVERWCCGHSRSLKMQGSGAEFKTWIYSESSLKLLKGAKQGCDSLCSSSLRHQRGCCVWNGSEAGKSKNRTSIERLGSIPDGRRWRLSLKKS